MPDDSEATTTKPVTGGRVITMRMANLMPGQDEDDYKRDVLELIEQLRLRTPAQYFIAQRFYDCLAWIRAYDDAKHAVIAESAIRILDLDERRPDDLEITRHIRHCDWEHECVKAAANHRGHTVKSLHALALNWSRQELVQLEQLSALRTKSLKQLQTSLELLVGRTDLQRRLRLHNEMMDMRLGAADLMSTKL